MTLPNVLTNAATAGITHIGQLRLLLYVGRSPDCRVVDVAAELGIDQSTIGNCSRLLETRGLLSRRSGHAPNGSRQVLLALTAQGVATLQSILS